VRGVHHAFGLASAVDAVPVVKVLALIEATRVTGVARNVLEYARLGQIGAGGVHVAMALALIRRYPGLPSRIDPLHDKAVDSGIPCDVLVERHRYDSHILDALRRTVQVRQPSILETHHTKSHCLVALSGLWREYTWVAFHHGYTQTDVKVRAYNHVDRWSLRHAAHVVSRNQPFAETLAERGVSRARITVLHNGVREMGAVPAAVAAARRTLGLGDNDLVVLTVGRLSREKGQAHLIRALPALRGRARLVIVGDGPDRSALEDLARALGVQRSVVFAGMTANVSPFYAMANVFVLPSLSEGSPNALLEAMACGLPVVATRVGGVPEIATDGATALLVPPKDPLSLARAIDRLLDDVDLGAALGTAARRAVLSRHTPEQRAATLSGLYAALTGTHAEPCRTG